MAAKPPFDYIRASLFSKGALSFNSHRSLVPAPGGTIEADWLDSPQIAAAVEHEPFPRDYGQPFPTIMMYLQQWENPMTSRTGPMWQVRRGLYKDVPQGRRSWLASYAVDGRSGEIVAYTIEETENANLVAKLGRLRRPDGRWEDMPAGR